jgi:hypothetical protein
MSDTDACARCGGDCPIGECEVYDVDAARDGADIVGEWEPCDHDHDDDCWDYQEFFQCEHQHCFACGGCNCPGYCDDYQTYNLRPAETGGAS